MKNVLIIAPHADDETLGCGGAILKHKSQGDNVSWLIATSMTEKQGYSKGQIKTRETEINKVQKAYGFTETLRLGLPTTQLDQVGLGNLISKMSEAFKKLQPNVVYLPYRGDAHSDHAFVFDAASACCKWFRNSSVQSVLAYETLSETGFSLNPNDMGFKPNVYMNIEKFLKKKIDIMSIYKGEMGEFPFPRNKDSMRHLAQLRGSQCGFKAAEAFMLLKEIR